MRTWRSSKGHCRRGAIVLPPPVDFWTWQETHWTGMAIGLGRCLRAVFLRMSSCRPTSLSRTTASNRRRTLALGKPNRDESLDPCGQQRRLFSIYRGDHRRPFGGSIVQPRRRRPGRALYDANQKLLTSSMSSEDNERMLRGVTAGQSYFLRIYGNGGALNPGYLLQLAVLQAPPGIGLNPTTALPRPRISARSRARDRGGPLDSFSRQR